MTWSQILGFSVLAATVTTAGTLLGLFLKEVVFVRSFEQWKASRLLEDTSRKYREPIALAALELCRRLSHICDEYPTDYLWSSLLSANTVNAPLNLDLHYQRHRLISTVYRLCALFGWIDLYRQDTTFLEANEGEPIRRVDKAIRAISADLADSDLNTAEDWSTWHDLVLFREEQRAVGESMIISRDGLRSVMGYAQFRSLYPDDLLGDQAKLSDQAKWIRAAAACILDPRSEKDFRQARMQRLIVHLVDLAEVSAPSRLRDRYQNARKKYAHAVRKDA
jgi:hypothetical protein